MTSAQVGTLLSATAGTWSGTTPITYAYVWKAAGVAISGATSSTFTPTSAQVGKVITVTVTATNAAGATSATSVATTAVTAATAGLTRITRNSSTGNLMRNGAVFRTGGANAFQIINNDYPNSTGRLMSTSEIDTLLDKCVSMNIGMLRVHTLFCNIGSNSWNLVTGVSGTGSNPTIFYNSDVLARMDYLIAQAGVKGVYLWGVMSDELGYYHGGKRNWVNQRRPGTCSTDGNVKSANSSTERAAEDYFYTDSQINYDFRKFNSDMLNRTNTVNGLVYKNDPTLAVIEALNEAWTADSFRSWQPAHADYIKSIAPNVLVADCMAADGSSYWETNGTTDPLEHIVTTEALNSASIDIHGIHPYSYFTSSHVTTGAQRAAAKGKGFAVGEYGWSKSTASGIESAVRAQTNIVMSGFWSLQNDSDLHNNGAAYGGDDNSLYYPGKDSTQTAAVSRITSHNNTMASNNA